MDTENISISPQELASRLARADAPLVLDVRREARFAEATSILPQAQRCAPEDVPHLARSAPAREVVVYCIHGLEVGRLAAEQLREQGWTATFLEGGIEGWESAGFPTVPKAAA